MVALPSKSHRCPTPFPASALPPPPMGQGRAGGTHPTAGSRPHTCPGRGRRPPAPGGRPGEGRAGAPAPGSRGPAPAAGAASAAPRLTCRAGSTMAPSPGLGSSRHGAWQPLVRSQGPGCMSACPWLSPGPLATSLCRMQRPPPLLPSPWPAPSRLPALTPHRPGSPPPSTLQCETGGQRISTIQQPSSPQ